MTNLRRPGSRSLQPAAPRSLLGSCRRLAARLSRLAQLERSGTITSSISRSAAVCDGGQIDLRFSSSSSVTRISGYLGPHAQRLVNLISC